ncbi:MAG: hypothetical protein QM775_25955 [Pirellulales bacterium]
MNTTSSAVGSAAPGASRLRIGDGAAAGSAAGVSTTGSATGASTTGATAAAAGAAGPTTTGAVIAPDPVFTAGCGAPAFSGMRNLALQWGHFPAFPAKESGQVSL